MRVLLVHNILWAHYKSSVFQALQQLADQRSDVTVKVLQIARNERSRASLNSDDPAAPVYNYTYELLFDRFIEDVRLPERVQALLTRTRAFRPDVLMLTGYYDPAQVLLLLWAKIQGIRVVMQMESTALDHSRTAWKERLKKVILGQFDGFFCFGNRSADYLIQSGVCPEKILLRRNAVDNNTIQYVYEQALPNRSDEQKRLGLPTNNFIFVGRLVSVKNLPLLVKAFAEASQHTSDWGLILLGDGPELEPLRRQIDALHITNKVCLLPGRAWYNVPAAMALADVLILPSISETWGLVVNEALACGLPVIVSDHCGCVPDLVHDGENGYVFAPNSPEQLTQLMLQYIDGKINWLAMQQAARQSTIPYSPKNVAQEMLAGFERVLTQER